MSRAPRSRCRAAFLGALLCGALGSVAGLGARPAGAATVLSHTVELAFAADGSFVERIAVRVRLDEAGDLADWSPWIVPLDENRTVITLSASAWKPDGSVVVLGKDDMTTVDGLAGGGVFHTSAGYRMVEFPPLPAGSTLQVTSEVREEPWLDSTTVPLVPGDAPVEKLLVRVSGLARTPRWRIEPEPLAAEEGDDGAGGHPRFAVEELPDGLRVTAEAVALDPETPRPVLRLGYGPEGAGATWADVGLWYEKLVAQVPRSSDEIRETGRSASLATSGDRELTAHLLDHVRRAVRYVAVEVGVGGYRPTPPAETLERRWGDCKDMSFLLIDLLEAGGVTAYPALARLDEDRRVGEGFPAADGFNHLIVAVPLSELDPGRWAAASDRYLFLDPTQDVGGIAWLHPALQGQSVLVVRGKDSELVPVPVLTDEELRDLSVTLTLGEEGDAAGEAVVRFTGRDAWALSSSTGTSTGTELTALARRVMERLLPGAAVGQPRWRQGETEGVPLVELSAPVSFRGLVRGRSAPSFALPGTDAFPRLAGPPVTEVAVRPIVWTAEWRVTLPPGWCPPEAGEETVSNGAGSFRQAIEPLAANAANAGSDGASDGVEAPGFRLLRRAELPHRFLGPALVEDARELALAESRAGRRRLRLQCPDT